MSIFSHPDFDRHEAIHFIEDEPSGLRAIIAVHSTNLGPSAGGTRLWHYDTEAEAITDALRLSRGMSFKNAMAGLQLGGGKGVIIRPPGVFDRVALFRAYGRAIEDLNGQYITAEDVGVSPDDMRAVKTQTNNVGGLEEGDHASGDPSPITAEGVFRGLIIAALHKFGHSDLSEKTIAVQGLGHVGYAVCSQLHAVGAKLIVADINQALCQAAKAEFGADVMDPDIIHAAKADVFVPCALGGAVNAKTVETIQAKIIAGAANNQLATPDMDSLLMSKGILYAPDFVINAGGIINIAGEVRGDYSLDWVRGKLEGLEETLNDIFQQSVAKNRPTGEIAEEIARHRVYNNRGSEL